jgi:hypothetical protein
VTLAVDAVVVAGGIFLGRLVARALRRRRQRQSDPEADAEASRPVDAEAPSARAEASRAAGRDGRDPSDVLAGFVCRLGDVVVRRLEGDEAWLAGVLVLAEERPVAALFIAPDSGGERAVLVPGPAQATLAWLSPIPTGEVALGREPPQALEHRGTHFERTRRLPVHVQPLGAGVPQVGARAVIAEYAADGLERLVVVVGSDAALAWRGVSLSEAEYDVLPGGQSTLA